jgi:hypothetical protein
MNRSPYGSPQYDANIDIHTTFKSAEVARIHTSALNICLTVYEYSSYNSVK